MRVGAVLGGPLALARLWVFRVGVEAGFGLHDEANGEVLAWHRERVCPFDLRRAMVVAKG